MLRAVRPLALGTTTAAGVEHSMTALHAHRHQIGIVSPASCGSVRSRLPQVGPCAVWLRGRRDARQRRDRLDRELAHRRLARQHHAVGAGPSTAWPRRWASDAWLTARVMDSSIWVADDDRLADRTALRSASSG